MKKIPTVFQRDESRRYVTDVVTPGCEWVLAGEGVATRKYDGTCVAISHIWYDGTQVAVSVRREVKPGKEPPPYFQAIETDPATGKTVGWEPYAHSGFRAYIEEALGGDEDGWVDPADWPAGTYELIGPRINGNPEGAPEHTLIAHADAYQLRLRTVLPPYTFMTLRSIVLDLATDWEGIVWHHPDGRCAKLKRRDFEA